MLAIGGEANRFPVDAEVVDALGKLANVMAARGGRCVGWRVAHRLFHTLRIQDRTHHAGPIQGRKVSVRRQFVIANVDFFEELPRRIGRCLIQQILFGDPVDTANQRRILFVKTLSVFQVPEDFAP